MNWPSFEFYAGNADVIAAAALAERWDDLHTGKITQYVALFPSDSGLTPSQVDLIEETVAIARQKPPVRFKRHVRVLVDVNDDGLSVGTMPCDWVEALATLDQSHTATLDSAFRSAYKIVFNAAPTTALVCDVRKPFKDLIWVCKQAVSDKLDVVEVFLANW